MGKKALGFFTASEQESITRAIEKAEKKTSGEIAVMVLDESDYYREALTSGAVISAILISLIIEMVISYFLAINTAWHNGNAYIIRDVLYMAYKNANLWRFLPAAILLYFPLRFLMAYVQPAFKLHFVAKKRIDEAVSEKAIISFYEKGLYRTRDATGILIFISLLERRVWILGDKGINEKISKDFWKALADELTSGIAKSDNGKAVCEVIEKCTVELERYFPIKSDDKNELPDKVIY
jgi:putative membrane protein